MHVKKLAWHTIGVLTSPPTKLPPQNWNSPPVLEIFTPPPLPPSLLSL